MGTASFREYSDKQAIVEVETQFGKRELIATLNPDHVVLTITEDEENVADFILYNPEIQKLFDWLKVKNVVT